ncbi:Transmembrane protein 85 [Zea mays]|uniref:Transmembrane protein 85 n=1 Tax=Zea mays TaxID=4577 RepID=A0A1D6P9I2_MAIZE|nr:Transmembrane protein 85 [Zea mays]AQL06455.1 Transmembrane protein 85 [Zea mays]
MEGAESLGSCAGSVQEPDDDGIYDVDGREHCPPLQHRNYLLCSVATPQRSPICWERYCLATGIYTNI